MTEHDQPAPLILSLGRAWAMSVDVAAVNTLVADVVADLALVGDGCDQLAEAVRGAWLLGVRAAGVEISAQLIQSGLAVRLDFDDKDEPDDDDGLEDG